MELPLVISTSSATKLDRKKVRKTTLLHLNSILNYIMCTCFSDKSFVIYLFGKMTCLTACPEICEMCTINSSYTGTE